MSSAKEERVSPTVCPCKGAALEEIYGHCFSWLVKGDLLGALKEGTNGKTIKASAHVICSNFLNGIPRVQCVST